MRYFFCGECDLATSEEAVATAHFVRTGHEMAVIEARYVAVPIPDPDTDPEYPTDCVCGHGYDEHWPCERHDQLHCDQTRTDGRPHCMVYRPEDEPLMN